MVPSHFWPHSLHLWFLLCASDKRCWKLKASDMSSFSIQTFCTHCLCFHISFSYSHYKQLNDELKGITLVILAVYKQVTLNNVFYYMFMNSSPCHFTYILAAGDVTKVPEIYAYPSPKNSILIKIFPTFSS